MEGCVFGGVFISWGICGCFVCLWKHVCGHPGGRGWLLGKSRIIIFLEYLCVSVVVAVYACVFVFYGCVSGMRI